jgi:hypothetical protein
LPQYILNKLGHLVLMIPEGTVPSERPKRAEQTCGYAAHEESIVRTSYTRVQCLVCLSGFTLYADESEEELFPKPKVVQNRPRYMDTVAEQLAAPSAFGPATWNDPPLPAPNWGGTFTVGSNDDDDDD